MAAPDVLDSPAAKAIWRFISDIENVGGVLVNAEKLSDAHPPVETDEESKNDADSKLVAIAKQVNEVCGGKMSKAVEWMSYLTRHAHDAQDMIAAISDASSEISKKSAITESQTYAVISKMMTQMRNAEQSIALLKKQYETDVKMNVNTMIIVPDGIEFKSADLVAGLGIHTSVVELISQRRESLSGGYIWEPWHYCSLPGWTFVQRYTVQLLPKRYPLYYVFTDQVGNALDSTLSANVAAMGVNKHILDVGVRQAEMHWLPVNVPASIEIPHHIKLFEENTWLTLIADFLMGTVMPMIKDAAGSINFGSIFSGFGLLGDTPAHLQDVTVSDELVRKLKILEEDQKTLDIENLNQILSGYDVNPTRNFTVPLLTVLDTPEGLIIAETTVVAVNVQLPPRLAMNPALPHFEKTDYSGASPLCRAGGQPIDLRFERRAATYYTTVANSLFVKYSPLFTLNQCVLRCGGVIPCPALATEFYLNGILYANRALVTDPWITTMLGDGNYHHSMKFLVSAEDGPFKPVNDLGHSPKVSTSSSRTSTA